jgi:F0F1-type ATP synthase assembly protein I
MVTFLKNILLTGIALAVLVIVNQWFGIVAAFVGAGICFVAYVLFITVRQMRDESQGE